MANQKVTATVPLGEQVEKIRQAAVNTGSRAVIDFTTTALDNLQTRKAPEEEILRTEIIRAICTEEADVLDFARRHFYKRFKNVSGTAPRIWQALFEDTALPSLDTSMRSSPLIDLDKLQSLPAKHRLVLFALISVCPEDKREGVSAQELSQATGLSRDQCSQFCQHMMREDTSLLYHAMQSARLRHWIPTDQLIKVHEAGLLLNFS